MEEEAGIGEIDAGESGYYRENPLWGTAGQSSPETRLQWEKDETHRSLLYVETLDQETQVG